MQIRLATAADIPSIMHLAQQSATSSHWTELQFRQAFQPDGARHVLIAEDSHSSALGFLVAQHLAPDWEIENIVVAPGARRKGLGKRLLDELLVTVRKSNSTSVFLEVRESNSPARSLYETAGFRPTGRRTSYYTNPVEDAILYRLTPG